MRIGTAGVPVGELIVGWDGRRETSVFTYEQSWIDLPAGFDIAPNMPRGRAPFFSNKAQGSSLPSPIGDGAPDSWGRAIIKIAMGGRVETDLDYLLESDDFLRSGALRYFDGPEAEATALASPQKDRVSIPRLLDLGQVIAEAQEFEADPVHYREKRADLVGGKLLKNAVGSLGGARPKVNARDDQGALWIVKLAKHDDLYAIARAEVMALRLASHVGIHASTAAVLPSGDRFPVAIVKRFDRDQQGNRIPFISAQTFMGLPGAEPGNYVDLAFQMHAWSRDPKADMLELYRRLAFNVLIQNTDDHLRNLGFLYRGEGKWGLSPAYDINPVPEVEPTLKTAISDGHGGGLDIEAVVEVAPYFEIDVDEATKIISTMAAKIKDDWRQIGVRTGMTASDLTAVVPAMDNPQIEVAVAMAASKVPGITV